MPTWLNVALLIILVLWTMLDVIAWVGTIYTYKKSTPLQRHLMHIHASGVWMTIITVFIWIGVLCYIFI